ncbi:MAG TPA: CapA family protein [Actinomycetes bacterium]|nr:CapA family protein [Actinomycetes bacterium]
MSGPQPVTQQHTGTEPGTGRPRARWRTLAVGTALLLAVVAGCSPDPSPGVATATTAARASAPASTEPRVVTGTSSSSTRLAGGAGPRQPTGAPVTLAFGGDVHFEGVIATRLARNPATAMGPVAAVLRQADLAMVNLETAVTTRGTPAAKEFNFRAPPSAFTALRAAGVDLATMANNHGEDFGPVGLQDSLAAAAAARFPVVGIGRDAAQAFRALVLTARGQRIAVVGATQVLDSNLAAAWSAGDGKPGLASAYQVDRLLAAIRAARQAADTVVVFLHWGRELSSCPMSRQRALAPRLVAAGADVVVGSHAHVLAGAGFLDGAYVSYGLGNFVFHSRGGVTARSGVLTLTVRGRAVTGVRWTPALLSGGVPIPMTGAAARQALASWQALRGCTGLSTRPASTG